MKDTETIVKSCEDLLSMVERCSDPDLNHFIVFKVFDILEAVIKERVGE